MTSPTDEELVAAARDLINVRPSRRGGYDAYDDMIEALADRLEALASLSRGEPEGWRDIASETPPPTGFFIGWAGEYAECWNCEVYHQAMSHSGPPNHWTAMKEIARTFTHWMPLPAPPAPEDKGR